ncbi:MAG: hypothetical protein AB8G05_05265 [Oligoflexales bacterium]
MKILNEFVLGMLLFLVNSYVFAGGNLPLPDLEFFENGIKPADKLVMDGPSQSELEFSHEGLKVMDFLARGGIEGKNYRRSRNITFSVGTVSTVGAIATAPTIVGPLIFLMLGGSGTVLAGANTLDEKMLARPHYNLGRLIKASYVHLGWSTPDGKKLQKHDTRIREYINKYLEEPADEKCVDFVARSVVFANEKGWFGFMVKTKKSSNHQKEKLVFVTGSVTGRKNIREVLFPNNRLSNLIHRDSSVGDKVASYQQ